MKASQFGMSIKSKNGKFSDIRLEVPVKTMKTISKIVFVLPIVVSTCVYDKRGTARFYLKKTADGVIREERY